MIGNLIFVNDRAMIRGWRVLLEHIEDFVDLTTGILLPPFRGRPDILDRELKRVYEVKSQAIAKLGFYEVTWYLSSLLKVYPGDLYFPGTWNPEQESYSIGSLFGIPLLFYLHGENIGGGVVAYTISPPVEVVAALVSIPRRVAAAKTADMNRGEGQFGIAWVLAALGFV